MLRLIALAAFAFAIATSAQAMSPLPLHQSDGMVTQVGRGVAAARYGVAVATAREACGPWLG